VPLPRLPLTSLLVLAALGCTRHWRPLDASVVAKSTPRTIVVEGAPSPDFRCSNPAGWPFWALGLAPGLVSYAVTTTLDKGGNQFLEDHRIHDPGPRIATPLAQALAERFSLEVRPPRGYGPDGSLQLYSAADLVLAVRTEAWCLRNVPRWAADGKHAETYCRVEYEAMLELRDTRTGRMIASGRCIAPHLVESSAPRCDAAVADDARFVKAELETATDHCVRGFASKLLAVSLEKPQTQPPAR
jgi:hypothetical protein